MQRDIFGDSFVERKTKVGVSVKQLTAILLGVVSALAVLFIIIKFEMVTALIALSVAELLTTVIPTLVVIILLICLYLKLKYHAMRRWWF